MKVKKLIKLLENYNPEAEVKMHHKDGLNLLFACQISGNDDTVFLEDASDNDLGSELEARFENLLNKKMTEHEFFADLIDTGFTLDDIQKYIPEQYEYSKAMMEKIMMNQKEYTLDESLFNEKQLREVKASMKQGLNVSIFAKP